MDAIGHLLDAMRAERRRAIGLGRLDDRWFTFTAGIGFDAAVVAAVERERRRGRRSTNLLYARVGLRQYFASDRRHPRLHLELADGSVVDNLFYLMVSNVDPWTFIGERPLRPTPYASFETGLDVYARRRMRAIGMLASAARMALRTPRPGGRSVFLEHDLTSFVVRADIPTPVQVDGDLLTPREKMQFDAVPHALSVAV